jgi:hypothetical protein
MSKSKLGLAIAVLAVALTPTVASANTDDYDKWFKGYEAEYLTTYLKAHKADCDVGRNIVDDNLVSGKVPSQERVETSTARLDACLNPPVVEETTAAPTTTTSTTYSGGVGGSTVQCESGGDYGANTGNGYYGGYQFDSGTWDAYGDSSYGEANEAPPAVQDAAAASVPYDAWPNC